MQKYPILNNIYSFVILQLLICILTTKTVYSNSDVQVINEHDLKLIQELDQKYQKSKHIQMKIKKTIKLSLLGTEKSSEGKLQLSQGKMRLELEAPEKSLVVIDAKNIWIVKYPESNSKSKFNKEQIIKAPVGSKKAQEQSFVGLLTKGGLLKYFSVSGTQGPNEDKTIFLQPKKEHTEFKRAQMKIDLDSKKIKKIKYWDELDNETSFEFSDITFNESVNIKDFQYQPNKQSEVVEL